MANAPADLLPTRDSRAFRDALGRFATGVAIVAANSSEFGDIGLTVSSLNSVSLDPPLLLFSIALSAHSLPALAAADRIGVSVLAGAQAEVSSRFARAGGNKWDGCEKAESQTGAIILAKALAHFECEPYAQYDGGDHMIFVVRVLHFATPVEAEPLVYFKGKYHALANLPAAI
jgi:flavin reductase (DIM6/NTAB) family NADH-FMN oxidoreductase RutF